jgi:23S rRNA (uridine2552-2'-O)-methyltransferase
MPKNFKVQDKYFDRAKRQGYLARSVFKLGEIQNKFKLIKKGNSILDLGAAPGSWLQYAVEIAGPKATLIGVDQAQIKKIASNVKTIEADIFSADLENMIKEIYPDKFDIILSDLAPKTSGVKDVDQARSIELNERVLELSNSLLRSNGHIVLKVFRGGDFDNFLYHVKKKFKFVKTFKPKASRDRSFEIYVIVKK